MLKASNVLNRQFIEKKILKYLSLPNGKYVIQYKKDNEVKSALIEFDETENVIDIKTRSTISLNNILKIRRLK